MINIVAQEKTMSKKLSDLDKQLILLIDKQVGLLLEKSSTDSIIINTLFDFIPDVKCLLDSDNDKLLEMHCLEYTNFTYFARLVAPL